MARGILQASIQNRGLVLDPRTKLVMLFDIALFVLGSAGGGSVEPLVPILCAMPAVLMLSAKKWKGAATYLLVYLLSWLTYTQLVPLTKRVQSISFFWGAAECSPASCRGSLWAVIWFPLPRSVSSLPLCCACT